MLRVLCECRAGEIKRQAGRKHMEIVIDWIKETAASIWSTLTLISYVDILDIIFVALLLYYVYKFIRTRRAGKLAVGVAMFILLLVVSRVLEMRAMQFILTNVFQIGLVTVIVVFQPELRSALEMLGGEPIKGLRSMSDQKNTADVSFMINEITDAVTEMSEQKTGALIVIERTTRLGDHIITGTVINSDVQKELIKNIFYNKAPLHDGAMIIRGTRIHAAGCLLPLSVRTDLIKDLGMRHRAAIGLSENSDAVIIVVSEETGNISLVMNGEITRNYTGGMLSAELQKQLMGNDDNAGRRAIRRIKKADLKNDSSEDRDKTDGKKAFRAEKKRK